MMKFLKKFGKKINENKTEAASSEEEEKKKLQKTLNYLKHRIERRKKMKKN